MSRCILARPQLVWSVVCATLIDGLLLLVGPGLALGAPLGSGSDLGASGYLRVALRTRLSGIFAHFGRGSERFCALDAVRVCRLRGSAGT